MATTTTTQDADQRKAEIKSDILLLEFGIIDEFRRQQWQKHKVLKTMPDGTQKWVRRPYWCLPKDQRPSDDSSIDQPADL